MISAMFALWVHADWDVHALSDGDQEEAEIAGRWFIRLESPIDWPLSLFTLLTGADLITWIMKNIDVDDQGLCRNL